MFLLLGSACSDDEPGTPAAADADVGENDVGSDTADVSDEAVTSECQGDWESTDVGFVSLGADGFSDTLTFEVPSCAVGFLITVEGQDDVSFILASLTNPNGELIITDQVIDSLTPLEQLFIGPFPGQFLSPNRMTSGEGVGVALVPNTPNVEMVGGEYQMVVQGGWPVQGFGGTVEIEPFDGNVQIDVYWKNADTHTDGGTLDLNLHFSGGNGLTAETAPTDVFIQGALTELAEIYSQVNMTIGEITYRNVDSSYQTIESIGGPGNELSDLFAESDGNAPGMNYFFVSRFEIAELPGGSVGGISGGIPGPPRPGTPRSGVAVSVELAGNDSDVLAHVMAHEGGHFLGLFHTVEFFGAEDPLPDTPTGGESQTNLMHPSVGGETGLTEQQSQVMNRHLEVAP